MEFLASKPHLKQKNQRERQAFSIQAFKTVVQSTKVIELARPACPIVKPMRLKIFNSSKLYKICLKATVKVEIHHQIVQTGLNKKKKSRPSPKFTTTMNSYTLAQTKVYFNIKKKKSFCSTNSQKIKKKMQRKSSS